MVSVFGKKACFELVAQAADGFGLCRIDGCCGPAGQGFEAVELASCALDIGQHFRGGHAFKVRQEDAQGIIFLIGCHKTVTSLFTVCMVLRKGSKAKRFAPFHTSSQRGARWPNLRLGETYGSLDRAN